MAYRIENRADEADRGGLQAPIVVVAQADLLLIGDVVVCANSDKALGVGYVGVLGEGVGARHSGAEDAAVGRGHIGVPEGAGAATQVIVGVLQGAAAVGYGNRVFGAGCAGPQRKRILIESRGGRWDVRKGIGLELRRRNGYFRVRARQGVLQALVVEEEEQFVLLDGTAEGAAEVMRIGARFLQARLVVEEGVGVEDLVVVVVEQVAVEGVAAALGHEVHLGAAHAAIVGAVGVEDHGGLGHFIGPERVVAGP